MEVKEFSKKIKKHLQEKKAFVAYRNPGETEIKALLQQSGNTFSAQDFTEEGFVFAPFDATNKALLIPCGEAEIIGSVFLAEDVELIFPQKKLEFLPEEKTNHMKLVKNGIKAIKTGKFQKVVLSRKQSVNIPGEEPWLIFERLLQKYPQAFVYYWHHPESGIWMGATPETLLQVSSNRLTTMALAGTRKNTGADAVVWGEKEKKEQALVTDFIVAELLPKLQTLEISKVETVAAGNLWHLKTTISGKLTNVREVKEIVNALHPTPAVCGLPKEAGKRFILKNEAYDREFYTGFLGELNMKYKKERSSNRKNQENKAYVAITKRTNLFVNLRCMKLEPPQAHLFVGGGITEGSDPENEWEETVNKAQTMFTAL